MMATNSYYSGQLVRVSAAVTDLNGNPTDPTTLTCKYGVAGESPTVLTWAGGGIVRDSLGMFHTDVAAPTVGVQESCVYQFVGTGAATVAGTAQFTVRPLPF